MKQLTKYKDKIEIIVFAALFFIKYGYYGFAYYPILDDYIQYGGYRLLKPIFTTVLIKGRTITTRPLASLSDPYIWGQLWHHMYISFFIITLMHLLSCWFFYQVFKKNNLTIGYVALLIYGFFPFGTEATYWISASSRIIVGMFVLSVALYLLSLYCDASSKRKTTYFFLFWLTHLMSFGYYEPTIALGFVMAYLIILNNRKKITSFWIYGVPLVNLLTIGTYYIVFSRVGNMSDRGQFLTENFMIRWTDLIQKVKYLWTVPQLQLYRNGIPRGFAALVENKSFLWMFAIVVLSILAGIIVYNEERYTKNWLKIVVGLMMMLVPYAPFFLLRQGGDELRIAFFSLLGLGIVLQGVFDLLAFNKGIRAVMSVFVSVAVCLMLLVHVSELTDYKRTSEYDAQIGKDMLSILEGTGVLEGTNKFVVLNNKKSYAPNNTAYATHIANATSSRWALTGMLRALDENTKLLYTMVAKDQAQFAYDEVLMKEFVFIGIEDDGTVKQLSRVDTTLVELEKKISSTVNTVEKTQLEMAWNTLKTAENSQVQKVVLLYDEKEKFFGYIHVIEVEKAFFYKIR